MPQDNPTLEELLLRRATNIGPEPPTELEKLFRAGREKLITKVGMSVIPNLLGSNKMEVSDTPYLHQFLNPEQNVFAPQNLRPKYMKNPPNIPWRDFGPIRDAEQYKILADADGNVTGVLKGQGVDVRHAPLVGTAEEYGLGANTKSIAEDEQGNPYMSIYDMWDFDSPAVGKTVGVLLNSMGQPFAVYGRYPLEREVGKSDTYRFKPTKPKQ